MTEIGDFRHGALRREQAAEAAMYRGDPGPFKDLWSRADDITLFGAFGTCKSGWTQVSRAMDWVGSRFRDGTVHSDYEAVYEGPELAYTVGYERGEVRLDGGAMTSQTIRVTQIYRREDGRWRLVHRHGDYAPVDQSPA